MQFSIPVFDGRIAPRCTVADSILLGTVRHGRITYSHKIDKVIRSSMDLVGALLDHKVKVLVCGGIDQNTRKELEELQIVITPNISGSLDEVLQKILDNEIDLCDVEPAQMESTPKTRKPSWDTISKIEEETTTIAGEISSREHDMLEVAYDINFEEERRLCRLAELVYFCLEMEYKSVGVAFCSDLAGPAETLVRVLRRFFLVHPVSCSPEDNSFKHSNSNSYCNPKLQADILNQLDTDLNVIVGLCIGADCIFAQRSQAPVTTLFVKDKALANNPIGAIYSDRYLKEASNPELQIVPTKQNILNDIKTDRSLS